MRIGAHPACATWSKLRYFFNQLAVFIEQLFWPITLQPFLQYLYVVRVRRKIRNWNLMRAPGVFDRLPVYYLRPSPALWRSQDDHRPHWKRSRASCPGVILNRADFVDDRIKRMRHKLVHRFRFVTLYKVRPVSISAEKLGELRVAEPG